MALQKQNVEVNLAEGLDTKTDKKHVIPGKVTALVNAVYRKDKRVDKRPGYNRISNKDLSDNELGTGAGLATFNDELVQYNSQKVYSYSPNIGKWVDKGDAVSAIVTTKQIIKNDSTQSQCDSAILNGVGVYSWTDSRGGVRASIYDETSGVPLLADVVIDGSAFYSRCLAFSNYLYVFYVKSTSLYVRRINPLEPTAFDTAVVVGTSVDTLDPMFDVLAYQDLRIIFAYNKGSTIKVGWLSDVPAVLASPLAPITISEGGASISIIEGPLSTFYICYFNTTDGFRCTIISNGGTVIHAPFDIDGDPLNIIGNITGIKKKDDTGIHLFYERYFSSALYTNYVNKVDITTSGTLLTSPTLLIGSVGIYSKAFQYTDEDDNTTIYIGVAHDSALQSTFFVVRSDGLIVAKQKYANGGGLTHVKMTSNVNTETSSIFSYAILVKNKIITVNSGFVYATTGVSKTKIDFTNANSFIAKQVGDNLLITGGLLQMYDGQSVVEHGFSLWPENNTIASASSGSLADGVYGVCLLYEWTDNYGQIHRSQPSVPTIITTSGGSKKITVVAESLRLTAKNGTTRSNVSIVCFVTEKNGSTYYRYTETPTFNDVTTATVTLPDITTMTGLNTHEILYTTGGVIPNLAPPACSVMEVFQNRLWLGGLEDKDQVWFSKENKSGQPLEFSDQFTKSIESQRGSVNAFGLIDDKFLSIKGDRVYYTYGDGPNDTNTLGNFSEFISTSIDVGTQNAKSVVRIPGGIMLKSEKGYYGIGGDFTSYYIGAPVEDFNDLNVTSATLMSDVNEVRFTTSDGELLVYNYYSKKWSTFERLRASDAVLYGSTYTVLRTDGKIYQEDPTIFKDDGAAYSMSLTTGWMAFSGLTGFKRVYRMTFLGDYKSKHKLRISVGYNYVEGWMHSVVFDPDSAFPVTVYGEDSPYGKANTVYGGKPNTYLVDVRPKIQKCTAIRFKIEEVVTSATEGTQQGLTISDMGLLIGVKPGAARLNSSRQVGLS